jgi:hypothetical protein
MKSQNDANSRKRKSIPRGKAKETPSSSPSASDVKVMYTILFLSMETSVEIFFGKLMS